MGCVNSEGQFDHWFGNIHLSGPCNRSCYFCIGQHMQSLERLNNLGKWPLAGIGEFTKACNEKGIKEINLTGTNTDPLLYQHILELRSFLDVFVPGFTFGLRTNGALALSRPKAIELFDKISLSIHSFDVAIYQKMMGSGYPPNVKQILERWPNIDFKINIVLGPENLFNYDLLATLAILADAGIKRVNLREPYGQPHIGNPMKRWGARKRSDVLGMPEYEYSGMSVVYWDVHYVEVESINLYANGNVSTTYPVTKGYDPKEGKVIPQDQWKRSGRQFEQWME